MTKNLIQQLTVPPSVLSRWNDIKIELIRKTIHMSIALVPLLAAVAGRSFAFILLSGGCLFYAYAEYLRVHGSNVVLVSKLTVMAARPRDLGTYVIGPLTLGLGAMLSLLLYPETIAAIAIYALAFGDGFASLVGKSIGQIKLYPISDKSLEGSLACFAAVFFVTYRITGSAEKSLLIAITATAIELLPLKDFDNLFLPIGVGLISSQLILV
jgi:dolichol kinase